MGPLMYRHRPAYPALIAAACVIVLGACSACCLKRRIGSGDGHPESLILILCLTVVVAGALVITAFARYKFRHLHTDRAFAKTGKKKKKHR